MSVQLTVIGLDRLGTSVGLALKSQSDQILRIGNDISVGTEQKALKLGAFDKVVHNIPAAVEEADIVLLSLPVDEVRKHLEIIAPILRQGAVVLDTSPLRIAVNSWVENLFPEERFFVSFTPTLNPAFIASNEETVDQASPDLFHKSLIAISAPASTHPDAIKLASDLVTILGGQPYFSDPYELDGLAALTDLLPKLTSAALVSTIIRQAGWREGRKLAGHTFYTATEPVNHFDEQTKLGETALLNVENTARVLDYLVDELLHIKELLQNQDGDELKKLLSEAVDARDQWWRDRQRAQWEPKMDTSQIPTSGQMIGKLFGLSRLFKDKSKTTK